MNKLSVLCPLGHICEPMSIQITVDTLDTKKILQDDYFLNRAHIIFRCEKCEAIWKEEFMEVNRLVETAKANDDNLIQLQED